MRVGEVSPYAAIGSANTPLPPRLAGPKTALRVLTSFIIYDHYRLNL